MFPENMDMSGLLAQAQAMQQQLQNAQAELEASEFVGKAGGELVVATIKGNGDLVNLVIKPEACDPEDTETLSDLVIAAVRSANEQMRAKAASVMPAMPGGFGF